MSVTLGVIADTHIPDRAAQLPRSSLHAFKSRQVDAILHAGDISTPNILRQLGEIAPVYAVRGNTDFLLTGRIPWVQRLKFEQVTIGMTHGHGNWCRYIRNKLHTLRHGPRNFSYYEQSLVQQIPDTLVVVHGHTHVPTNYWLNGQLLFNPGSPTKSNDYFPSLPFSVGFLHISDRNVKGEIVFI